MNRLNALALTLVLLSTSAFAQTNAVAARIDRILRDVPLIDGHNDLPWHYEERVKDHMAQIVIRQDQSKLTPALHTDTFESSDFNCVELSPHSANACPAADSASCSC